MALIKCYECGKEISDTAPSCPGCGALKKLTVEEEELEKTMAIYKRMGDRIPKCTGCGGILEKITGVEDLFQYGNKHRCTKCGHLA